MAKNTIPNKHTVQKILNLIYDEDNHTLDVVANVDIDTSAANTARTAATQVITVQLVNADGTVNTVTLAAAIQALIAGVETSSILSMAGRRADSFNNVPVDLTCGTAAQVVKAATAAKSIYITDITVSVDTATSVKFQDTAGTPVQLIGRKFLPANSVWSKSYKTPKKLDTNVGLNVVCSATSGNITIDLDGYVI